MSPLLPSTVKQQLKEAVSLQEKENLPVSTSAREIARASLGWGRAWVKASAGVMGCGLILIMLVTGYTVTLTYYVDPIRSLTQTPRESPQYICISGPQMQQSEDRE